MRYVKGFFQTISDFVALSSDEVQSAHGEDPTPLLSKVDTRSLQMGSHRKVIMSMNAIQTAVVAVVHGTKRNRRTRSGVANA